MRYDYRCPACKLVIEVNHPMAADPVITCDCGERMHIVVTAAAVISVWGNRSIKSPERPSNAEYHAYNEWEAAGGLSGTREHKRFQEARGESVS